ncbi:hypothetical protein [Pseudoduganella chitinolytica]|uniref:Uncharacterized protein n=1 Tax=Pseudoduganella chitinolytica TaxID=34070 RepID=A0ABY8BL28_9BURK|nr:hypothetical protein [Pseudoduganella chitinolytica]WEF35074.1 hypothetical protein PX653_10025 [Pseudoduganella chitinolytica]
MPTPGKKARDLRADASTADTAAAHTAAGDTVAAGAAATPDDDQRARRLAILRRTAGMWKDRADIAKDGVQFQLAARAEWA